MKHEQPTDVDTSDDDKKPDRSRWKSVIVWSLRLANVARWIWQFLKDQ